MPTRSQDPPAPLPPPARVQRAGLARRLLLAVVLFSSAITAVITTADLYVGYRRDIRAIEGAFDFVGNHYLPALVISVWAFDDRQVRSQLDALAKLPDVRFVGVEVDGRPRWSVGQLPDGRLLERRLPLVLAGDTSGRPVGQLHMAADIDQVLARVWQRLLAVLVANAIKTMLVAVFLLLVFHRMVTRHLERQAGFVRAVRPDGSVPGGQALALDRPTTGPWRPDILDALTADLNHMLESLRSAHAQLARSRAAAAESALRLRSGLEAAHAGVWEWVPARQQIELDAACCRLLGIEPACDGDAVRPLSLDDFRALFVEADVLPAWPQVEAALASEGGPFRVDMRARSSDGAARWLLWRGRVVERTADGAALRARGTLVDVHERRLAQDALQHMNATLEERVAERTAALQTARDEAVQASRAKSEFLSRMSHELRTPLNAILGFAQIFALTDVDPQHKRWADEIRRAGEHLLHLIEELLDLSRIEVGQLAVRLEAVDAGSLVEEAFGFVRAALPLSAAPLSWHPAPAMPRVHADPLRLRQVLVNLLTNAVKYNRGDAGIEVRAELQAPGRVRLSVSDHGIGIPRDRALELFEPFSRLGRESSAIDGAGVGLSLSRRLAELMGGELGFSSEEGCGSVFWIELPVADAAAPGPAVAPPPPAPAATATPLVLLYVEDNPANRQLVQDYSALQAGWHLVWAETGAQALELAPLVRPHLILLDLHLPDMDGYAVAAELGRHPATARTPVVAVTADAMPADVARGLAAGLAAYLTKPLVLQELSATVERLVAPPVPGTPARAPATR